MNRLYQLWIVIRDFIRRRIESLDSTKPRATGATNMQFLSLLTTLFNTLGKDKVNQLIPLLTALLKAAKAKDWTTVLLTVMQIIEIVTGGKVTPKPPVPGPGPVFASASDEGQFVSECVAAGGDSLDAQELVDELK